MSFVSWGRLYLSCVLILSGALFYFISLFPTPSILEGLFIFFPYRVFFVLLGSVASSIGLVLDAISRIVWGCWDKFVKGGGEKRLVKPIPHADAFHFVAFIPCAHLSVTFPFPAFVVPVRE